MFARSLQLWRLEAYEQLLIQYIIDKPDATYEEIVKATGFSRKTVERRIQNLKGKGILSRIGGTRGSWEVNQWWYFDGKIFENVMEWR